MNRGVKAEPTPPECALAAEMFDHFCSAITMKQILSLHREICNTLHLKPNRLPEFYPKLKAKLASSWKAQALFKKFDARANHKVYGKGKICSDTKVLIIGAGPCGLRAAIECQLLGSKVVVIEKRDRLSRNNVLHLWPFVIHDLRALGAKKFYGKFCAGSINHICIRQLQCILMKVSLLLGVEIYEGIAFEELLQPSVSESKEILGWRARVSPDHPVSQYEFDVLIGADGKRNTLKGFKKNEFRGKLAIGITANFINRHTEQEAAVPEISGVAYIFYQKFFKDLSAATGIDLENIVYYKDDTHYFVMTAKKQSLIKKGVLVKDYPEVSRLLNKDNMDKDALMRYAQEAARFSTNGRLPTLDFALNHCGEPDVALFDFSAMYTAENASIVYERLGRRLLCQLVGDSLMEPFWPTGSGCARGFLSALDASWAVRSWGQNPPTHPLLVIAERESIYRLLPQTTTDNLQRDLGAYTLDPGTRYPNLNRTAVSPTRVTSYYQSDDPLPLDTASLTKKRRRDPEISEEALIAWVGYSEPGLREAASPQALNELVKRYRPDLLLAETDESHQNIYKLLHKSFGIPLLANQLNEVPDSKIRSYLTRVYYAFKGEVPHIQHECNMFSELKENQKKNSLRYSINQNASVYSHAAESDKSHSAKRKRRIARSPQVSTDPVDYIRKQIGKLDLNDITQLARLIEGHDAIAGNEQNSDKQIELQEQILALLDPEESPDPMIIRESLTELLQGTSKTSVKETPEQRYLTKFFSDEQTENKKPTRRLKGLDPNTIKVPDFSSIFQDSTDTDDTLIASSNRMKNEDFKSETRRKIVRANSAESFEVKPRRMSDELTRRKNSDSLIHSCRSNSIGSSEMGHNIKEMKYLFDLQSKNRQSSSSARLKSIEAKGTPDRIQRWQQMADIIEGKRHDTFSSDPKKVESIGNAEMADRRQKITELILGKPRHGFDATSQRRSSGELAFRMQRVSNMMEKKNAESKRPKSGGRRKAAREITKQRFEKSLQLLSLDPRTNFAPHTDLEHDYGLQQYRANAPQFDERVRKLEKQLQHYGEGKSINEPLKASGSGIRVARLAAELSNTSAEPSAKASKPKDLMRSVGKISQQDWNVKQIEKKITENRLGRPEPTSAERVPKWDREQFLGRQRRLQEGDSNDEKWEEIDVTIQKIDQKLHDTGRPLHGTKKVAKLAKKFVSEDAASSQPSTSQTNEQNIESSKKVWRGLPPTGKQCPVCEHRVYAAEGITADGLHLHRACFRCAICNTVLRPGNYTRERYGIRLVCLRHYATHVPESVLENLSKRDFNYVTPQHTPERIYIELSDNGGREIDEDEWTDRNFFTSEASAAGELSDDSSPEENVDGEDNEAEEDQSEAAEEAPRPPPSDMYLSDDSYGYDDYSDDGAESSNESLSNMREAREARRREVPADAPPPYTSSEMESDEDSDSSDDEKSSATEVSTDSEFAREESVAIPSPPAILVTEVPSLVVPPPQDYPLSRTKSAGGLATKRALELKRKYLLGEPSPPTVRKSESTSQLDSKLEAFRSNITEFQKMLHPATPAPQTVSPYLTYQLTNEEKKPRPDIPDIIKNLCNNVPVDLLTKGDSPLCKKDWNEPIKDEKEPDLETDSLSDDSSESETVPNQSVPRVEVHDEGGELIQLDSLILVSNIIDDAGEKISGTATESGPTVVAVEPESSESGKDATTLALTETELSDWAAESVVLDEFGIDDNGERKRNKNPRTLSGPKLIHDAKNIESISTHVCGRNSPELVVYSNAPEHFEFADEGEQDPSIAAAPTPCNDGYMELVDDDYEPYSTSKDRSMNFIERVYSDTTVKSDPNDTLDKITSNLSETLEFLDSPESESESILLNDTEIMSKPLSISNSSENMQQVTNVGNDSSSLSYKVMKNRNDSSLSLNEAVNSTKIHLESLTLMENSPSLLGFMDKKNVSTSESSIRNGNYIDDQSPPLVSEKITYTPSITSPIQMHAARSHNLRTYSPAICRSASETFNGANSRSMNSPSHDKNWSISTNFSNPVAENHSQVNKVQELKREREEQTEVVRRLVLERLGGAKVCRKSTRRNRVSPSSFMPPPIPPPPLLPAPPSPVLGTSHLPILPPSNFPAVPPRPSTHPRNSLSVQSSFSDPELTRQHRPKSFIKSISNYFNKRLGPRYKQNNQERLGSRRTLEAPPIPPPPVDARSQMSVRELRAPPVPPPPVERTPHISVKAPPVPPPPVSNEAPRCSLEALEAPPVPPPPACYSPPCEIIETHAGSSTQIINESIRRDRDKRDHCCRRRLEKLERRLSRQLSAADEAATVAEILELSARHDAHEAMNTAVGRRNAASSSVGD